MEDENRNKKNINPESYVYDISNTKTFEPPSIFTISGNSLNSRVELVQNNESEIDESDSDVISDLIGHIGPWQLFWAFIMCLYQFPTTFHIFCLVFQVSFECFQSYQINEVKLHQPCAMNCIKK
jgi:hypothetical protein